MKEPLKLDPEVVRLLKLLQGDDMDVREQSEFDQWEAEVLYGVPDAPKPQGVIRVKR